MRLLTIKMKIKCNNHKYRKKINIKPEHLLIKADSAILIH